MASLRTGALRRLASTTVRRSDRIREIQNRASVEYVGRTCASRRTRRPPFRLAAARCRSMPCSCRMTALFTQPRDGAKRRSQESGATACVSLLCDRAFGLAMRCSTSAAVTDPSAFPVKELRTGKSDCVPKGVECGSYRFVVVNFCAVVFKDAFGESQKIFG